MKIRYEDYQNMIYNLAHRFQKTTNIDFDELISCGNLEFVRCQKSFDPMLASFSTYLTIRIKGLFLEMSAKERRQPLFIYPKYNPSVNHDRKKNPDPIEIWDIITNKINQEDFIIFKETLQELSEDAKEVIQIVFETPMDLIKMIKKQQQPRGVNKHQLQKLLRKQGWSFCRIWKTFKEISTIF